MATDSPLHRTPLYERHRDAGARLVPFAGWEMPVQYEGVREEHLAVRSAAGVFDVSHMGQIETEGPQASAFLQRILSNDVERVAVGGAQYALLCREDGGVLDDLFSYRLGADRWLTVTNAANHEQDLAWFAGQRPALDVAVRDAAPDHAMLALQGPRARELAGALADAPLPARMTAAPARVAGVDVLACGTATPARTGSSCSWRPADAPRLWDVLVAPARARRGWPRATRCAWRPASTCTATTSSPARDPISAGLGWAVAEDTGFIGADACRAVREAGPARAARRLRRSARRDRPPGQPDRRRRRRTSGTSRRHGRRHRHGLRALRARAVRATQLEIDVRGRTRTAHRRDPADPSAGGQTS